MTNFLTSAFWIRLLMISLLLASGMPRADVDSSIAAVLADPGRPAEHRSRDAGRKPGEVLAVTGIGAGDRVADIAAAGGYYTALLSRLVGDEGRVYAVDPQLIFEVFPSAREGFQRYLAADPRDNVEYSVQRLDAFTVPETLDSIFMALYYHDTYWTGEDRDAMNRAFHRALRPGGTLFVLDHNAKAGSGEEVTQSLHRMDHRLVVPEISRAGFELVAEHDFLRNPEDPLDTNVFDEDWRGRTDRFIYVFRKLPTAP